MDEINLGLLIILFLSLIVLVRRMNRSRKRAKELFLETQFLKSRVKILTNGNR